ncbi:MAG: conserved exported protein of unknown function [Rhodospirillaceae bacterium]|nr:MAG: conserved exported protein of unknown function [Rhodospirillaceae bacterium]
MQTLLRLLAQGGLAMTLLAPVCTAQETVSDESPVRAVSAASESHLLADRFMGRADAPVTVIGYSSLTCPHCAEFHTRILPRFKTHYIDTGKVKFIYRDFPLERVATAAAMLARCAPYDMYFRFLDALFGSQKTWSKAAKPRQLLASLARLGGMSEEEVDQCLGNATLLTGLTAMRNEARDKYGIKATPSFVIGNKTHVGIVSYEVLVSLVEAALPQSSQ